MLKGSLKFYKGKECWHSSFSYRNLNVFDTEISSILDGILHVMYKEILCCLHSYVQVSCLPLKVISPNTTQWSQLKNKPKLHIVKTNPFIKTLQEVKKSMHGNPNGSIAMGNRLQLSCQAQNTCLFRNFLPYEFSSTKPNSLYPFKF